MPPKPKTALIFSNYAASHNYIPIIQKACDRSGIALSVVGEAVGNCIHNPETILKNYDLIFAKGKAAIEGIVTGAAVIACDIYGLGGMVTTDNLTEFKDYNFGNRILKSPLKLHSIEAEIKKYNPDNAKEVCRLMRNTHLLDLFYSQDFTALRRGDTRISNAKD